MSAVVFAVVATQAQTTLRVVTKMIVVCAWNEPLTLRYMYFAPSGWAFDLLCHLYVTG